MQQHAKYHRGQTEMQSVLRELGVLWFLKRLYFLSQEGKMKKAVDVLKCLT